MTSQTPIFLLKPFISAHEFLHDEKRWVLWLKDADSSALNALPHVRERVKAVDRFRKSSKAKSTREYPYPTLFRQVTQPDKDYVLIPCHTSENRLFIPLGFFTKDDIVGNSCFALPGADRFHFGVLQSTMHMSWVRAVCGRLKSDYRYSKDIVYNNFPWPQSGLRAKNSIKAAAQEILSERQRHRGAALADLYDPLTMPPGLVKAHQELDHAVDAAYGKNNFANEAERVAFLFSRYEKLTSLFTTEKAKPSTRKVRVREIES